MSEDGELDPEVQAQIKAGFQDEAFQDRLREAADRVRAGGNGGLASKAKGIAAEIKENFKADEGSEGVEKTKSMFTNLWKSGVTGKIAIVVAAIVIYKLVRWII